MSSGSGAVPGVAPGQSAAEVASIHALRSFLQNNPDTTQGKKILRTSISATGEVQLDAVFQRHARHIDITDWFLSWFGCSSLDLSPALHFIRSSNILSKIANANERLQIEQALNLRVEHYNRGVCRYIFTFLQVTRLGVSTGTAATTASVAGSRLSSQQRGSESGSAASTGTGAGIGSSSRTGQAKSASDNTTAGNPADPLSDVPADRVADFNRLKTVFESFADQINAQQSITADGIAQHERNFAAKMDELKARFPNIRPAFLDAQIKSITDMLLAIKNSIKMPKFNREEHYKYDPKLGIIVMKGDGHCIYHCFKEWIDMQGGTGTYMRGLEGVRRPQGDKYTIQELRSLVGDYYEANLATDQYLNNSIRYYIGDRNGALGDTARALINGHFATIATSCEQLHSIVHNLRTDNTRQALNALKEQFVRWQEKGKCPRGDDLSRRIEERKLDLMNLLLKHRIRRHCMESNPPAPRGRAAPKPSPFHTAAMQIDTEFTAAMRKRDVSVAILKTINDTLYAAIGTHQHHPQPTPQVEEELQKLFDLVGGVPDEVKRIQEAAERKKIDADPDKDLSKEAMAQYIACVRSDEWGGFCELMALCNIFHFKAVVTLQNGKEAPRLIHTDAMDILRPRQPAEGTDIYLDFERGSHWNLADPTTIRRVEQPAPVAHPGNLPAPRGPSPTSST